MATVANDSPPRPRILVVDDDPGIRMAIRSILETEYIVTEAESIKESLAIFDKQAQDLITLDIQMPEVTGMQGLSEFRHRSVKLPIILISGYRTFELAQEALRLGANDYLTKPFTVQELRQTVKAALNKGLPSDDADLHATKSASDFMVRLPLQDLLDDRFLSPLHRSHFLAFAQNALSDKARAFETISVSELIKTVTIQFDALALVNNLDYKVSRSGHHQRIHCDMYLLGGALANLALTCILETRNSGTAVEILFDESEQTIKVRYQKSGSSLSARTLAAFEHWHYRRDASVNPNSAMLVLVEKVVSMHEGQLTVKTAAPSDFLVEITLPSNRPPTAQTT